MKDQSLDILRVFYDGMMKNGMSRKLFRKTIDDKFVDTLNSNYNIKLTLEACQTLTDNCLANEWLEHTVIGTKYGCLRLTTTGFDIIKSKITEEERLENRSIPKRISDYVDDHSGIVALLSFIVSLFRLSLKTLNALILNEKNVKIL